MEKPAPNIVNSFTTTSKLFTRRKPLGGLIDVPDSTLTVSQSLADYQVSIEHIGVPLRKRQNSRLNNNSDSHGAALLPCVLPKHRISLIPLSTYDFLVLTDYHATGQQGWRR